MRKRIGIEAQGIFKRDKNMLDLAALDFIKELQKAEAVDYEFIVLVRPGPDECISSSGSIKIVKLQSVTLAFWEQIVIPAAVQKHKLDLLHCTSGTAPLDAGIPLVLTFQDYTSPGWLMRFYRKLIVPRVVKRAHAILTPTGDDKARALELSEKLSESNVAEDYSLEQVLSVYKEVLGLSTDG